MLQALLTVIEQRPDSVKEPFPEGLGLPHSCMLTAAQASAQSSLAVFLTLIEVRLPVFISPTLLCLHLSATPPNFYELGNQITRHTVNSLLHKEG